jgi:hypothetical protein
MTAITSAEVAYLSGPVMPGNLYTVKVRVSAADCNGCVVNTVAATLKKNAGGVITQIQSLTLTKISPGQWQANSSSFPAATGDIIFADVTAASTCTENETATALEIT